MCWEDSDDYLFGVNLRDHAGYSVTKVELLGGNSGGQGLSNGSGNLVFVRTEFGDSDINGFADVEDVLKVKSELSTIRQSRASPNKGRDGLPSLGLRYKSLHSAK